MKISGGSVSGGGTWLGGKKLKCTSCGNESSWNNINMSGGKAEATCGQCGTKVKA